MDFPTTIDFETEAIEPRPHYPPKPVGCAVWEHGKEPVYLAWGHPQGNNMTLERATEILRDLWRGGRPLLFHNAKFDLEVAYVHLGLPYPAWDRYEDTLFLLFLAFPHLRSLGLKEAAQEILGDKPEEQRALYEHLVSIGAVRRGATKQWGAHIAKGYGGVVGQYAIGDVIRTFKLWQRIRPPLDDGLRRAYDRERKLLPVLLRNEQEGLRVDADALVADEAAYTRSLAAADEWLRGHLKTPSLNVDSNTELAEALRVSGAVLDFAKTATGRDSVAKGVLTVDRFTDPEVFSVLGYRNRLMTCLTTFIRPWCAMAAQGGRIHTSWNQVRGEAGGARTGRMSGSPNFMNIPKSWTDKGDGFAQPAAFPPLPLMRSYILPDEGHEFLHRDYNQQELRILSHYEDGRLLAAYNADPWLDIHTYVQEAIKEITGLDLERRAVKILNFGILYGMGLAKLTLALNPGLRAADIMLDGRPDYGHPAVLKARMVKEAQQAAFPGLANLDKALKLRGRQGQPVRTWGGRLYFAEEPKVLDDRVQTFEYKLLNYLIQGSAADCTKEALIRYDETRRDGRLLVTVHDEINVSAPPGSGEDEVLRKAMESVEFDVPMLTDGKSGPSWGLLGKQLERRAA